MKSYQELHITHIRAGYGRKDVIRDLSVSPIRRGSVTAVIGPNAAGKSTLLRAFAGLARADGSLKLDDMELLALPVGERAAFVSFMPQHVPGNSSLLVMESVVSALKASAIRREIAAADGDMHKRALDTLEHVGIAHLVLEPLNQLSEGQRQLVSLVRALVRAPVVLLLDEPTSALDLRHQIRVMKLIRDYAAQGGFVITILHDLNLAMRFADNIILMENGDVVASGAPEATLTSEVIRQVYNVNTRIERCSKGMLQVIIDEG